MKVWNELLVRYPRSVGAHEARKRSVLGPLPNPH